MKRKFNPLMILKFAGIFIVFAFAIGFVTMSLWNWLVPLLFAGPVITYWQAIGLLILSKILFGGFKGGRGGPRGWNRDHRHCDPNSARGEYFKKKFEERFARMHPEDQEAIRNKVNNTPSSSTNND